MPRVRSLHRTQPVALSKEQAFARFSDVRHLAEIAPPFLDLTWVTDPELTIEPGCLIDYRVRIHGIGFPWTTRILAVEPPHHFAYEQARGPLVHWAHAYHFESADEGCVLRDEITYEVGYGLAGRIGHRVLGRGIIEAMFDHRAGWIAEL